MDREDAGGLEAEIAAFLANEAASAETAQQEEAELQREFLELVNFAQSRGVSLPDQSLYRPDGSLLNFDDFVQHIRTLDSRTRDLGNFFTDTFLVKVVSKSSTKNSQMAISERNLAVAELLNSQDISTAEKDQLLKIANDFLEGVVDPLLLPTGDSEEAREAKSSFATQITREARAERIIEINNRRMRHAATELIKLRLKSIAGREHDDLELLSSHIVSAAEWITLSQLTNGTIDDEQIVRTMAGFVGQNAGVNMGIENDVIRDLIYRTFYFFLESGYLLQ